MTRPFPKRSLTDCHLGRSRHAHHHAAAQPASGQHGLWRPDLLVREILTADQISGGRVEIAVGAGVSPGGPAKPLTHLRDTVLALRASLKRLPTRRGGCRPAHPRRQIRLQPAAHRW